MLTIQTLTERAVLEAFLRRQPALHLYSLGDLDEAFYPQTRWYGACQAGELQAIALLYTAFDPPVLLALGEAAELPALHHLLTGLLPRLPGAVYAHLSPGMEQVFQPAFTGEHHGLHAKMRLTQPERLADCDLSGILPLDARHTSALLDFYAASNPQAAFDPSLPGRAPFFGLFAGGQLVSVAGVHVYSPALRVAAIGNVATLPEQRGRGHATRVTAALCQALLAQGIDLIGLNVLADNAPAIASYRKLGFVHTHDYHEWTFHRQSGGI